MKEKEQKQTETLLTSELYSTIVEKTTGEILELKQNQGETINNIKTQKEILKSLRKELKKLKKEIRLNKRVLRTEKVNLTRINDAMDVRHTVLTKVNREFLLSEEAFVNINECLNLKKPKQKKII